MDIENLTSFPVVVINSLLTLLKANHIDINSVVMQLSSDKDEDINLGELTQQTLNELQKAKAQKVAVPDTHILMPKEATQEIYRSFQDAFNNANAGNTAQNFKVGYKAMIEAQEQVG